MEHRFTCVWDIYCHNDTTLQECTARRSTGKLEYNYTHDNDALSTYYRFLRTVTTTTEPNLGFFQAEVWFTDKPKC